MKVSDSSSKFISNKDQSFGINFYKALRILRYSRSSGGVINL